VAARVGARRQERAQHGAAHATNFSNQQQQNESQLLHPEPRAFDESAGLLSGKEIEEAMAAADGKADEGASGNGAANGGGERSCAVSLLSETSTVREFRDGLSAHGLSMMASVIIEDMGIESAAELESYTYDKFVGDLAADVPNFVLKRAQITKLRKLFAPNETYMPLGQMGSELPVAAVPG
jgi:hypothetical protein